MGSHAASREAGVQLGPNPSFEAVCAAIPTALGYAAEIQKFVDNEPALQQMAQQEKKFKPVNTQMRTQMRKLNPANGIRPSGLPNIIAMNMARASTNAVQAPTGLQMIKMPAKDFNIAGKPFPGNEKNERFLQTGEVRVTTGR